MKTRNIFLFFLFFLVIIPFVYSTGIEIVGDTLLRVTQVNGSSYNSTYNEYSYNQTESTINYPTNSTAWLRDGDNVILRNTNDHVCINCTSTDFNLDVDGTVKIRDGFIGFDAYPIGTNNLFIGEKPSNIEAGASGNLAVGVSALDDITTGDDNVAIGFQAATKTTTGGGNFALGYRALFENVVGASNIAIGKDVRLFGIGGENVCIGSGSCRGTTGISNNFNVMIGSLSGNTLRGGNWNTFIGYHSGQNINNGAKNLIIGTSAGNRLTDGDSNIFFGDNAGYRQTTNDNLLIIDNQRRASIEAEENSSIIYGIMASNPADQRLNINAILNVTQKVTSMYFADYLYHHGDTDTYQLYETDRWRLYAGAENLIDVFEGGQDYVKLGDGGDVDINLNDDLTCAGDTSQCTATAPFTINSVTPLSLIIDGTSVGDGANVDIAQIKRDSLVSVNNDGGCLKYTSQNDLNADVDIARSCGVITDNSNGAEFGAYQIRATLLAIDTLIATFSTTIDFFMDLDMNGNNIDNVGALDMDGDIAMNGNNINGIVNLDISGNYTGENAFLPQLVFSHTDETKFVLGASIWTNMTFDQENADIKRGIQHNAMDNTNHTFLIMEDGIYDIDYDYDLIDDSVGASDIDVAGRVIMSNGLEINGSVFESTITKQGVETELSHNFVAELFAGEILVFQFIATDEDVVISTHGTFGEHPESASIIIEKRYNI